MFWLARLDAQCVPSSLQINALIYVAVGPPRRHRVWRVVHSIEGADLASRTRGLAMMIGIDTGQGLYGTQAFPQGFCVGVLCGQGPVGKEQSRQRPSPALPPYDYPSLLPRPPQYKKRCLTIKLATIELVSRHCTARMCLIRVCTLCDGACGTYAFGL